MEGESWGSRIKITIKIRIRIEIRNRDSQLTEAATIDDDGAAAHELGFVAQ
jgi:hypothetical protein